MLALSTGTNNVFPIVIEATVAGMALGLIATVVCTPRRRARKGGTSTSPGPTARAACREIALVDACVNTIGEIGARAVWKTDTLRELYCTFAEPDAIGLSSIPGRIMPTGRAAPNGVAVLIGPNGRSSRTSPRRGPSSNPVRSRTFQDQKSSRWTSRAGSCRMPCSATPSPGTIRCCSCMATAVKTHGCSYRSRIAADRATYALDLPGHGASSKDVGDGTIQTLAQAVLGLLDTVGLNRLDLVGHSMGGAVITRQPADPAAAGKVASLTLISPVGFGPEINAGYLRGFAEAESRRDLKPHLLALFADPGLVNRQLIDDLLKYKRLDGVDQYL